MLVRRAAKVPGKNGIRRVERRLHRLDCRGDHGPEARDDLHGVARGEDERLAATAVVHGANNVLKASLLGRLAERKVVLRFGLPAVAAALVGAWVLGALSGFAPLTTYSLLGRTATVTPLKLVMALLMLFFAVLELHPRFEKLEFDRKYLPAGGLLSGFFGGLSGHQGALRSAFLAKVGISPEGFVGTNAVIGLLVDVTRL